MLGIINGEVYDPRNGINGEVRDIWIEDGKIVSAPAASPPELGGTEGGRDAAEIIDATGLVVMPGGVDIHSHIVGAKVNAGRKFRPEDHRDHVRSRTSLGPPFRGEVRGATRSGSGYTVPSTYMTGYLYAEMGYTTVMEAATAPLVARHTHEELEDTPILDKGVFITMGNNHFIMNCIRNGQRDRDYVAWLLEATKGYAIKIVNPGGVENWKWGRNVSELDDEVIGFGVTPRQIVTTLAWINDELGLPHVPHIHAINLGQSGNARTTVEMIEALEGRRAHFCHLQFLSDGPLQYRLHQLTGNKWLNDDVEGETGGGVVPMQYKRNNPFNAVQWLTGMELFLLIDDPWRVFLTTDHPNAGPFFYYPQVIKLLMDRDYRAEMLAGIHHRARKGALLAELDREYSLYEIAIITRAGTARALGLQNKGHLGVGADADVTIYAKLDDKEEMFARPRYVLKDGEVVVRDGRLVHERPGRTLYVTPPEYLPHCEVVPCA